MILIICKIKHAKTKTEYFKTSFLSFSLPNNFEIIVSRPQHSRLLKSTPLV